MVVTLFMLSAVFGEDQRAASVGVVEQTIARIEGLQGTHPANPSAIDCIGTLCLHLVAVGRRIVGEGLIEAHAIGAGIANPVPANVEGDGMLGRGEGQTSKFNRYRRIGLYLDSLLVGEGVEAAQPGGSIVDDEIALGLNLHAHIAQTFFKHRKTVDVRQIDIAAPPIPT